MWEDTIVQEVRAIREEHAARFGFDVQAILADLKRHEQFSGKQYVTRRFAGLDFVSRCSKPS